MLKLGLSKLADSLPEPCRYRRSPGSVPAIGFASAADRPPRPRHRARRHSAVPPATHTRVSGRTPLGSFEFSAACQRRLWGNPSRSAADSHRPHPTFNREALPISSVRDIDFIDVEDVASDLQPRDVSRLRQEGTGDFGGDWDLTENVVAQAEPAGAVLVRRFE